MPHLEQLISHYLISYNLEKIQYIGAPWPILQSVLTKFPNISFITSCPNKLILEQESPTRSDLVIIRSSETDDKHLIQKITGRAKNLLSEKVWVYDEGNIFEFSDLLCMGFKRHQDQENSGVASYYYNLENYNNEREWNNPKNWANPDRWNIRF